MMDMSSMNMNQDNSTSSMQMLTAFTTELGQSNLWFTTWTPTSSSATAGACIGLFFLSLFSRFLSAFKTSFNISVHHSLSLHHLSPSRTTPPFVPSIDIPRGILFGLESFVAYMLMLAVMTYSAWFFISIILGGIVGEIAFGRLTVGLGGLGELKEKVKEGEGKQL